jgi:predicted secreted Zn-dependent protease
MRRPQLLVAALLIVLGGCSAAAPTSAPPVSVGPAPSVLIGARPTADPCATAVAHLAAFTSQLGHQLAALRPKVTDPAFDSGGTALIIARVSSTMRSFDGLEERTAACAPTAILVGDVARVRIRAGSALDASSSASVNDSAVQRDAAVTLFGLLADVQRIATATGEAARTAGIDTQIALVPDASTKPLGSLPPLDVAGADPTDEPPVGQGIPTYTSAFFGPNSTVTTYRVTGATQREIILSILTNGPPDRWLGGHAEALTLAIPHDRITFEQTSSGCRVGASADPAFYFSFKVTLPRWVPPSAADRATITWWISEIRHVATHENHHVDLWRAAGVAMTKIVASSTCLNLETRLRKIVDDTRRANCEFDMREYGAAMGLSIETCLKPN